MMTNGSSACEDRDKARKIALERVSGYLVTMVNLYHDTMPKSTGRHHLAGRPAVLRDIAGNDPEAFLDQLIAGGYMLVGNPEEVSEQLTAYSAVGCDQLVFGLPQDLHHDEILEMHRDFSATRSSASTTPTRSTPPIATGRRPFPNTSRFSRPLADFVPPTVLPVTAALGQL